MKVRIFFIIYVASFSYSFAQNISLDELTILRKKDLAQVEEFLTAKSWDLILATDATETDMATMNFAYKKSNYDDTAESFINYYYSPSSGRKRLNIQIHKNDIYNKYVAKIKALGCKLVNSEIKENKIIKVYQGKTTTFEITVNAKKDSFSSTNSIYHIFITDNDDSINLSSDYMWTH